MTGLSLPGSRLLYLGLSHSRQRSIQDTCTCLVFRKRIPLLNQKCPIGNMMSLRSLLIMFLQSMGGAHVALVLTALLLDSTEITVERRIYQMMYDRKRAVSPNNMFPQPAQGMLPIVVMPARAAKNHTMERTIVGQPQAQFKESRGAGT